MTREEEIRMRYEKELEDMRREQSSCTHEWDEVKYDPEYESIPCDFETHRQGVDFWMRPTRFTKKEIPRWSRTCKICGKVKYTKEQTSVKYEPKF